MKWRREYARLQPDQFGSGFLLSFRTLAKSLTTGLAGLDISNFRPLVGIGHYVTCRVKLSVRSKIQIQDLSCEKRTLGASHDSLRYFVVCVICARSRIRT